MTAWRRLAPTGSEMMCIEMALLRQGNGDPQLKDARGDAMHHNVLRCESLHRLVRSRIYHHQVQPEAVAC